MQNENRVSPVSFASLFCVFTVANGIITAPDYKDNLIPLIIACVSGVLSAAVFTKLSEWFFCLKNEILSGILYAALIAFAIVVAFVSAREYTGFVYESVLVHENRFLIKLIFAACVFCLSVSDIRAIYKFSFLSAVFVSIIFIALFFTSFKTFDLKNLKGVFSLSDIGFRQTANYCLRLFLSVFGACAFAADSVNIRKKSLISGAGVACGVLLCLVIIFDTVLSFGLPFASRLPYPYIDDISTVTAGSLFTRMDGFSYFAFFVCYLLKCAVLTRLSANLISKAGIKKQKIVTAVLVLPLLF